jgi:hypothetical protein
MSPTTGWHVDGDAARRYAARALDATDAASVDAHLLRCAPCRAVVNAAVAADAGEPVLEAVWRQVDARLDQPRRGWLERLLTTAGAPPGSARLVTATSRARWAYLAAVAVSLVMALLASRAPDREVFGVFLLVAPLGPLVATASAFGHAADPAHALLATVPTSAVRLLLVRTAAAVVPALVLTGVSVLWLLDEGWLAAAWLAPSLALATGALALSRWLPVELAATALGVVWVAAPLALRLRVDDLLELLGTPAQIGSLIVVLVGGAVFALSAGRFAEGEG